MSMSMSTQQVRLLHFEFGRWYILTRKQIFIQTSGCAAHCTLCGCQQTENENSDSSQSRRAQLFGCNASVRCCQSRRKQASVRSIIHTIVHCERMRVEARLYCARAIFQSFSLFVLVQNESNSSSNSN